MSSQPPSTVDHDAASSMREALLEDDMEGVRRCWPALSPRDRGDALAIGCEFHKTAAVLWMLDRMGDAPCDPQAHRALVVAVQKNQVQVVQRMVAAGMVGEIQAALVAAIAYEHAGVVAVLAPAANRINAVASLMEDSYDDAFQLSYEEAMHRVDALSPHLTPKERQTLLQRYEPDLLVQVQAAQRAANRAEASALAGPGARKMKRRV